MKISNPVEEHFLDNNLSLCYYYISHQKEDKSINFENISFLYFSQRFPSDETKESIYFSVPFYIFIQLKSRKNTILVRQIQGKTVMESDKIRRIYQKPKEIENETFSNKYKFTDISLRKEQPTLIVLEGLFPKPNNQHDIINTIIYSFEGKTEMKQIKFSLNFQLSNPFIIRSRVNLVGFEGVLAGVEVINNMKDSISELQIDFINSEYFLTPYSESNNNGNIFKKLLPNNSISKIYQLEFSYNKSHKDLKTFKSLESKTSEKFEVGHLNIRFLYHGIKCFYEVLKTHEITINQFYYEFPLSIEMIGSPQSHNLLTPFTVKIHIHNSIQESISVSLNIDISSEDTLVPYGTHLIETKLSNEESPIFFLSFIGLKQGLLNYPSFHLEFKDENNQIFKKTFHQESGVLILQNISEFQENIFYNQ